MINSKVGTSSSQKNLGFILAQQVQFKKYLESKLNKRFKITDFLKMLS